MNISDCKVITSRGEGKARIFLLSITTDVLKDFCDRADFLPKSLEFARLTEDFLDKMRVVYIPSEHPDRQMGTLYLSVMYMGSNYSSSVDLTIEEDKAIKQCLHLYGKKS